MSYKPCNNLPANPPERQSQHRVRWSLVAFVGSFLVGAAALGLAGALPWSFGASLRAHGISLGELLLQAKRLVPDAKQHAAHEAKRRLGVPSHSQPPGGSALVGVLTAVDYARLLQLVPSPRDVELIYHSRATGSYVVRLPNPVGMAELGFDQQLLGRSWSADFDFEMQSFTGSLRDDAREPREGLQWYSEDWSDSLGRRFPFALDQKHPVLQLDRVGESLGVSSFASLAPYLSSLACDRHAPLTSRSLSMQAWFGQNGGVPGSEPARRVAVAQGNDSRVEIVLHDGLPDGDHPDLEGLIQPKNMPFQQASREFLASHGTHAAGIVSAQRNRIGVAGVLPGARIAAFPLTHDEGRPASLSQVVADLSIIKRYLEESAPAGDGTSGGGQSEPLRVMLLGYGAEVPDAALADSLRLILSDILRQHNVFMVVPAGNIRRTQGVSVRSFVPSDLAAELNAEGNQGFVLPVGASDVCSRRAWFSHASDAGNGKQYFAPGYAVYSTLPQQDFGFSTGTSSSAAIVAGIVASLGDQLARLQGGNPALARHVSRLMLAAARPISFAHSQFIVDGLGAAQMVTAKYGRHDGAKPSVQALGPWLPSSAQ